MGVWVSAHGLRRVGFFVTTHGAVERGRRGPYGAAAGALARAAADGAGAGAGRSSAPAARSRCALLTDHNADFLSRAEAFDRAADTVEAWADEYRPA